MEAGINILALGVSVVALVASLLSWRTAVHANRTAIFDQRFQVYTDVQSFLRPWHRDATPDINQLPMLIGAWDRSHFLFDPAVTQFIRQLWLDAVRANFARQVMRGDANGDRDQALATDHELTMKYLGNENVVRAQFLPHMRVATGSAGLPLMEHLKRRARGAWIKFRKGNAA